MLVKMLHGGYLEKILKFVCWSNVPQIEFKDGKMYDSLYIAECHSIKVIYPTYVTLL